VDDFAGQSDVCVTFTVRHVGESDRFIFVQEQYRGDFTALVMSKSIFSKDEAESLFEGETVEVRGNIEVYEGEPQIKVYEALQIVVTE
jgi:DNA/RNA endonuclease YhcR with UshA esterase domain